MKSCMNVVCGTTSSSEWKSGWCLRSGDFALLCDKCGYAFDKHIYCEEFHTDDSGWRNCNTCGKRLHCGCIASLSLIELLDGGGVKCAGCPRNPNPNSSRNGGSCAKYELCTVNESNVGIHNHKANNGSNQLSMPRSLNPNAAFGLLKEGLLFPTTPLSPISMGTAVNSGAWRAEASWASTLAQTSMGSFLKDRLDASSNCMQTTDNYGSLAHPNLNMSLGVPTANLQFSSGTIIAEKEQRNVSNAFNQGFVSPSLALTPPKSPFSPPVDTNTSMMPQLRLARPPPGEGRGRHQLLPRYWPRITDQELQQISGDSNCTIIPLFEKVLSASDAGRIGRLVLPKACAEAYFPHISLPEGLPIKIQDVKGKEWIFQFRFWPNNNSRMYVLEGVTPCIQSMQLQAGDTVTFSRKDPEGKLIMGYRKASNLSMQNLPVIDGCFGRLQSVKGSTDAHMNALSRQMDSAGGNVNLHSSEKCGEPIEEGLLPSTTTEKKKSRNIGGKSKRLHIDNKDVQALRLTWEEIQGMLRPPPNAKPSIVVIEDFEFEEYEEPPVFGKSSVFASRSPGAIEQWAQCDSCSKWRRIPSDFLLPPKWTCMDNAWDPVRCFCSAPDELSPRELEFINRSKDSTKKRMTMPNKAKEQESSSGLSALANAAVFRDSPNEPGTSAIATTTKHPRHRPGCSCIVCIQPPSGKGKHCSTCTCTVCMTVKRRFKTLMMRKKNRQTDQGTDTGLKTRQIRKSKKEVHKVGVENNRNELDHQIEGEDLLQVGLDQNLIAELADSGLDLNDPSCMVSEEEVSGDNEGQRVEEHPISEAHHEQVNPSDERCEPENNSSNIESSPVK